MIRTVLLMTVVTLATTNLFIEQCVARTHADSTAFRPAVDSMAFEHQFGYRPTESDSLRPRTGSRPVDVIVVPYKTDRLMNPAHDTTMQVRMLHGKAVRLPVRWAYDGKRPPATHLPVCTHWPNLVPPYPYHAYLRHEEGTVRARGLVTSDGRIREVQIFQSIPTLDGVVSECMFKSRWRPARDTQGNPVEVWVEVPVRFTFDALAPRVKSE